MNSGVPFPAGRRETWVMGLAFAGLLFLPLVAWGVVRAVYLPQRTPCTESCAMGGCRTYASAQTIYRRIDWDKDGKLAYAPTLQLLNTTLDGEGNPIQLIDPAFVAASSPDLPRLGYCFREMSTIAGQPIDWEKDFALCATPAVYGRTGYRTFIVKTDGTVLCKDLGRSCFVTDFPADPMASGWFVAE